MARKFRNGRNFAKYDFKHNFVDFDSLSVQNLAHDRRGCGVIVVDKSYLRSTFRA